MGLSASLGRGQAVLVESGQRYGAYSAADLAVACSGTVNMELALAGTPQLALYRTSWLTTLYIRAILRPAVRHATLPNLLSGREVLPELLLERCAAEPIASEAARLLGDASAREAQLAALGELLPRFGVYEDGELVPPSLVAARAVLRHLQQPAPCRTVV